MASYSDSQLWESDEYIMKIERLNQSYRGVIFSKKGEALRFVEVMYDDTGKRIKAIIKKIGMVLTNKSIVLRKNDAS